MSDLMQKIQQGRQYRNVKEIRSDAVPFDEEKRYRVRGYATTYNEPYTLYSDDDIEIREQVAPEAFADADMSDVIMQYNHEGRVFARTSNNTLAVAADEVGLAIEAELSGTEIGRQLYEEIEGGYTTKMSMGFRVAEDKREVIEDRDNGTVTVIRTITKISKLYDVSAVSLPANDATSISARSFGEGVVAETVKEIDARKARDRQKQKVRILLSLED